MKEKMKILTILGARPQFVKAGAVSRAINDLNNSKITEIVIHTGQHYDKDMSDLFFEELHLPKPNYFLGAGGKSHGAMTGEMIIKLEEIMLNKKPDIVLVYGDTNSILAGAITASKLHIPLAHVEAGLRSFNMKMPEEINRILTDRVSKWLFCPTDTAVKNLKNEGFDGFDCSVLNVGDVMLDVAIYYKQFAKKPNIEVSNDFILCTIHRAENTDNSKKLKEIFEALETIAKDTQIILPLHPRTKKIIQNLKFKIHNLTIINPVGYLEMVWLLQNCKAVLTDSGGLQKEAYFFKKPCVTLRDETEWVELVEIGANVLVGSSKEKIITAYKQTTNNQYTNTQINQSTNLYGDGRASKKILKELLK